MASSDTPTTPDDRPRLRASNHVRDREIPTQTLLVLENKLIIALIPQARPELVARFHGGHD